MHESVRKRVENSKRGEKEKRDSKILRCQEGLWGESGRDVLLWEGDGRLHP